MKSKLAAYAIFGIGLGFALPWMQTQAATVWPASFGATANDSPFVASLKNAACVGVVAVLALIAVVKIMDATDIKAPNL